jgi:hypothetical protein
MYSRIRRHGQVSRQNKNRMTKEILNINEEKETVQMLNMKM